MALRVFCYVFGGSLCNNASAAVASFRSKVKNVVSVFYDVKIVFNNDDGVSFVYEVLYTRISFFTSSKCRPVVGSSSR